MHKNPSGMKVNDRRMRRARLIRDGMSWRQACIKSGYSLATANRGPRGYLENKPGVQKDFARAAEEASYKPEFVKKAVTHRLMKAMEDQATWPARRNCLANSGSTIFVNPTNATSMGIFEVLADPENHALLDQSNAEISKYFDEPCAWCGDNYSSARELQAHSLVCSKRPNLGAG